MIAREVARPRAFAKGQLQAPWQRQDAFQGARGGADVHSR